MIEPELDRAPDPAPAPVASPTPEPSIVDLPALAFIIGLLVLGVALMLLMVHR